MGIAAEVEFDKPVTEELTADLPVERIIRRYILECAPDTPICKVAERMSQAKCSSILVVDGDQSVGIWTERDALRLDFTDEKVCRMPVREVMSSPVKTVLGSNTLQEVAVRFGKEHVRHFLVVNDSGERIGVVSQTDAILHQGIEHYLRLRKVRGALKRDPLLVPESASMQETAALMREQNYDAAVIRFPNDEYGIITERDVVRAIARRTAGKPVGELASRPLIAVNADASLFSARNTLIDSRLRHIGVLEGNGKLIGLISFADILADMELAYIRELKVALKERDEALVVSQRNLHLAEKVIESSLEGVVITNLDGTIQSINPAFTKLTGYKPEDVVGKTPHVLSSGRHDSHFYKEMWDELKENACWHGEIWNRRKNGEIYPELLTITVINDENGEPSHYAGVFSDISELKQSEEQIRHLAYYDPLTALANRRLFYDRLQVAVAHARRTETALAVMYVDLDRFKRVNDSLGHSVGDRLLQEVASRLQKAVREDDTVARIGGDEFAIMLTDAAEVDGVVAIARRVVELLQEPVVVDELDLVVTCSIGIAFFPDDAGDMEELVQNADVAMYRAKDLGRSNFQLYSPAMNARSLEHLAMETGLRRAVERDELELYYQPVVDATNGNLLGIEALVRWNHPDMGLMPPADFIPLAEENGLILPIGEWVINEACRQQVIWEHRYRRQLHVAVNISARQFHDEGFLDTVKSALENSRVTPSHLIFELTETLLMEDAIDTIRAMDAVRAMGVGLSLDDFGTGYSSLSYLKRFPIDILKIDRSFIRGIENNPDDAAIVSAVINLAHSLRLQVIAEGVEKESQLKFIRRSGAEMIQGYYFDRPLPAADFERRWLHGHAD